MSHFLQFLGPNVTSFLLHPIVLAILAFIFILLFKWSSTLPNNNKNSPPSPPKLPIIGNLHQLGMYPHHSLQDLAQLYSPLMLLKLGNVPTLAVSSADAAREIMKTNDVIFANRPKTRMFGVNVYYVLLWALGPTAFFTCIAHLYLYYTCTAHLCLLYKALMYILSLRNTIQIL